MGTGLEPDDNARNADREARDGENEGDDNDDELEIHYKQYIK
jgi:hypothetical protein